MVGKIALENKLDSQMIMVSYFTVKVTTGKKINATRQMNSFKSFHFFCINNKPNFVEYAEMDGDESLPLGFRFSEARSMFHPKTRAQCRSPILCSQETYRTTKVVYEHCDVVSHQTYTVSLI